MALSDYVKNKPTIVASSVVIRPMSSSDVPSLSLWLGNPEIYRYWGKGPSKAEKDPSLLFSSSERETQSFHLGIALKDTDAVIGDLWVYQIQSRRMATVAIRLSSSYQGRGLGTEALSAMTRFVFENTELERLEAEVDVRNIASVRMLEKCFFVREGLIRQGRMVNTWCDYYIYGLLKSDIMHR